jgi:hypothetical protein
MAQAGKGQDYGQQKKPHCTSTVRLKNSFIITKTKNLLDTFALTGYRGQGKDFS